MHHTDTALKTAVTEELAWTPGVNSTTIGVAVNGGAVTLSGEVDSYPEKRLAEHAAFRVRGVTAVAEEVTVRDGGQGVNDTDIAREAGQALDRSVSIPAGMVSAAVHDHAITLSGQVGWHYQREAAEHAVRHLKGVVAVNNTVTIRPTASTVDIKAAITSALVRTARSDGSNTTVTSTADGTVTLDGTVHSWSERRDAEHAAWSAPGVTDVTNRLRIQY
jgi:osmotically-inducible protein OsmY